MSAAEEYAARVEAVGAQRARWRKVEGNDRWDKRAAMFRLDPRRELDRNLAALAELLQPDDTVLDVGGGAGRVSLPLALRCRGVVNIEPSPAMRQQFEESAKDAGIANASAVDGTWPRDAAGLRADVVLISNVTYFVREIVPFVEALERAARRLVVISVWSIPPPNHASRLYELVYGEPVAAAPSHRELLPVLWDRGLLPDVRVLPEPFRGLGREVQPTRETAIAYALNSLDAEGDDDVAAKLQARFDELFERVERGFRPTWAPDTRELLISWPPSPAG